MSQVRLRKVDPESVYGSYRTVYDVLVGGKVIGRVMSYRKHTYRGTEGWNRGLRCRDFHPIRWSCEFRGKEYRGSYWRSQALRELLEKHDARGERLAQAQPE